MERRGTVVLLSVLLTLVAASSWGQRPVDRPEGAGLPLSGTVGLRLSFSNVDPPTSSADLDLTVYTRGFSSSVTSGGATVFVAGFPYFGYPAIDFGDGSTVSYATVGLTNTGGGPGGSNVYRSLASFSHSYPGPGSWTAHGSMPCFTCFQVSSVFFPTTAPPPTAFTTTFDARPTHVIGNQPLQLVYAGTYTFSGYGVRYSTRWSPVVTNTAQVLLGPSIPTASEWGLAALGAALLAAGVVLLRRR